jgi:hypothetical protein
MRQSLIEAAEQALKVDDPECRALAEQLLVEVRKIPVSTRRSPDRSRGRATATPSGAQARAGAAHAPTVPFIVNRERKSP